MKSFIKSLELRLSDLLLLVGFIPFAIFLIFGQLFMQYVDPNVVSLPIWAAIICFVIVLGCWGYYLYLEFKRGNAPNRIITYIFAFLILLAVITIAVQPSTVIIDMVVRQVNGTNEALYPGIQVGDIVHLETPISLVHRFYFMMNVFCIGVFIYIGLFVFPKRFTSVLFVKYLGYAVLFFVMTVILFGYFTEYNLYIPFIKTLLGQTDEDPATYAVKSYIIHRNAYGMVMMIGIIFAFINHSIEKKWYYYLFVGFFYVNMVFSYCKTGLLISALLIAFYVLYRLITTYQEHKKRNKILLITFISLGVIALGIVGLSLVTKGKFLGKIYTIIVGAKDSGTLDMRAYIWDNSFQLLQNGWWLIGRGFGTYNLVLMPMNTANGDMVFPAHSAYVGLLAQGGIFFLLGYIALLGYYFYLVFKCFKKEPGLTITLTFGAIAFIIYSFTEAIQYLVYVFLFPIMILYHTKYELEEKAN